MSGRVTRSILAALCVVLSHVEVATSEEKQSVTLKIEKMFCVLCGNTVKKSLSKVEGVKDVHVDVSKKVAIVSFDPTKTTVDDLTKATAKAGFPAIPSTPAK
jgi:periplasmic mercuric ion binding protein